MSNHRIMHLAPTSAVRPFRLCGLAVFAFAAAAPITAPAAAQDIVVTAQRIATDQETPASVSVLRADALDAIAPQVPSEALNRLPGVSIQRNNGVENLPAIRSPVFTGGQSAGSFLVLENGVPIRAPGFANVNQLWEAGLEFADRVEVLRGPGSSLYGSNAVHGVVNVVGPSGVVGWYAPRLTGRLRLEAGAFGRISGVGVASHGDPGATHDENGDAIICLHCRRRQDVFAAVSFEREDGWRDQSDLARQALVIGANGETDGWVVSARLMAQNLNQESAGFIQGIRAYDSRAIAETNPAPEAYRDTRLVRAAVTMETDGGGAWTVGFTPYARFIEADLNLFFFPSGAQEITRQTGGGLQAAATWEGRASWRARFGVDVDFTRGTVFEVQDRATIGTFPQGVHYDYAVDMLAAGAYGELAWDVAEAWTLTLGARGEHVAYAYDNLAPDGDFGRFRRPVDRDDDFQGFSPRIALAHRLADSFAWVNLTRGLRPPQITDLYSLQTRQTPGEQGLETTDAAEIGWRQGFTWGEGFGSGDVELVAYHMDKRDTAFRGADGFTVTGGRTRHQGIEASATIGLGEAWSLAGWVAYARHTYRFDSPADGIASGALIDTAPEWTGNLRFAWAGQEVPASAELEWAYVGEYFTDAANTRTYPGHSVFTLRGAWRPGDGDVELFAAVRNLTNTGYADRADFAFGNDRYFPGAPRGMSVGVRLER